MVLGDRIAPLGRAVLKSTGRRRAPQFIQGAFGVPRTVEISQTVAHGLAQARLKLCNPNAGTAQFRIRALFFGIRLQHTILGSIRERQGDYLGGHILHPLTTGCYRPNLKQNG